ncbi:lipopolysaccharide transport periplasmic protein LptA [Luteimonas sp. e5]
MRRPSSKALIAALVLVVASGLAMAKSSDRRAVMHISADHTEYNANNDGSPTVLTGNVVITQGTLKINAARAEVYQSGGDISRTVLSGNPVTMSQEMDDGTPMSTRSTKVDYDMRSETVILTGGVVITQPRGNLRGERVVYNMRSGQVQSGGQGSGRVQMTIKPRNAEGN